MCPLTWLLEFFETMELLTFWDQNLQHYNICDYTCTGTYI